jgi:8-oxo-dGTP diphosphatase
MSILLEPGIRNAARAVIVRDEQILLLRKYDQIKGERYALPGGSQEPGETLIEALSRECREEIGCDVRVRDLLHVADYFKPRATEPPTRRQIVEFLFACDVAEDYRPHNGSRPDRHQVEVLWLPRQRLPRLALPPAGLIPCLMGQRQGTVYQGTLD